MSTNPTVQQKCNPWFGISMMLLGLIVGYGLALYFGGDFLPSKQPAPNQPQAQDQQAPELSDLVPYDKKVDYAFGNPDAKVILIEYSDIECPFCKRHHPVTKQLVADYGEDLALVLRHFPLNNHPNAKPSAEAAECVGSIAGAAKYWEFIDILFDKGPSVANHLSYALEIGIDENEFTTCVENKTFEERVQRQLSEGAAAGVRGTPGNFVYNTETKESVYVSGAQPIDKFKAVIDEMLK